MAHVRRGKTKAGPDSRETWEVFSAFIDSGSSEDASSRGNRTSRRNWQSRWCQVLLHTRRLKEGGTGFGRCGLWAVSPHSPGRKGGSQGLSLGSQETSSVRTAGRGVSGRKGAAGPGRPWCGSKRRNILEPGRSCGGVRPGCGLE